MVWINVNDVLPSFSERVIVKTETNWIGEVRYIRGSRWIRYDKPELIDIKKLHGEVLKWSPLPK